MTGVRGSDCFIHAVGVFTAFRGSDQPDDTNALPVQNILSCDMLVVDINGRGQIVGSQGDLNLALGYLYDDGEFLFLNEITDLSDGWNIVNATGINELGQISATACRTRVSPEWTDSAAVLLRPDALTQAVPEQQSFALILAGPGALGWVGGRQRR